MVEFSNPEKEAQAKEFSDLHRKKEETMKELQEEKEKRLDELKKRQLALETLRRDKEEAERKLKELAKKEKVKSDELDEEEKKLKEEAEALAKQIEKETEVLAYLHRPAQEGLEEAVAEATQQLPPQPVQEIRQEQLYQAPLPQGGSLYQRLAELRGGIYGVASHRVSSTGELLDQERSHIGSLYSQLQDIVQGLASHAIQGRKMEIGDETKVTEALNQTMQAVEHLGEAYASRFENLLNRARGYIARQEAVYKVPGT